MPVPEDFYWADDVLVDAKNAVKDQIDAGSGPGVVRIYDESDVQLAEITLTDPCGTVDSEGLLTITPDGPDLNADATGVAAYGEILDSDDNVVCGMPTREGTAAQTGEIVLNSEAIIEGAAVTIVEAIVL